MLDMEELMGTVVMMDNVSKNFTAGLAFRKRQLKVLQEINLHVASSSIFGLLGPSGCGKTTLLKCIIGRLAPNSGKVTVFGHRPGTHGCGIPGNRVGYMPQDIALTEELSVNETLRYFGQTAGMDTKYIKARSQFLLKLLQLEMKQDDLLGNLSGGQKRRISFAVALLHQPPLLILDEPTVGLDPIMRQSIWEHLTSIVATSSTTIIITTHYIEEAKNADKVGLMLNGVLAAHDTPQALIDEHRCSTLEEVFLKVSLRLRDEEEEASLDTPVRNCLLLKQTKADKQTNRVSGSTRNGALKNSPIHEPRCKLRTGFHLAFVRFIALVVKTVIFSSRNPASIVLEVMVPPLLLTAFSVAVGKPLFDLQVGVVNQDQSDLGQLFLNAMDKHTIKLVQFENYTEAREAFDQTQIWGIIYLNPNFSEALLTRTTHGILSDNVTLEESNVNITLDDSYGQVAIVIHTELLSAFLKFSRKFMQRLGLHQDLSGIPLKVNGKDEAKQVDYNQFLMPGFILALTYFTAMGSTTLNRASEKQMGCIDRYCVAGVSSFDLVFSELFVHLLLFVLEGFLDFGVLFWIFGLEHKGSLVLAFFMLMIHGVVGMSFGIMISAVTDYVATAMSCCIAVFFIGIMLQGVLWPLEGVPYAVRYLSLSLWSTLPTEAMRDIINRGWGLLSFPVYMGFIVSILWAVVFLSTSLIAFHLRI